MEKSRLKKVGLLAALTATTVTAGAVADYAELNFRPAANVQEVQRPTLPIREEKAPSELQLEICGKKSEDADMIPITLKRIVDGDTQDVTLHLVSTVFEDDGVTVDLVVDRVERLRLLGVDTPEKKGKTLDAGLRATGFSAKWYEQAINPYILRWGRGKFGRPLVAVCDERNRCLNHDLIESQNALYYCGGNKKDKLDGTIPPVRVK